MMSWNLADAVPLAVINSIILEYCEFENQVIVSLILPHFNASYWRCRRKRYGDKTHEEIDQDTIMSLLSGGYKPPSRMEFIPSLCLSDLQYLVYHCVNHLPITYEVCVLGKNHVRSLRYFLTHLTLTSTQYLHLVTELGLGNRPFYQSYLDINAILFSYGDRVDVHVDDLNATSCCPTVWLRILRTAPNIAMKYVSIPSLQLSTASRTSFCILWNWLRILKLKADPIDHSIRQLYINAMRTIINVHGPSRQNCIDTLADLRSANPFATRVGLLQDILEP